MSSTTNARLVALRTQLAANNVSLVDFSFTPEELINFLTIAEKDGEKLKSFIVLMNSSPVVTKLILLIYPEFSGLLTSLQQVGAAIDFFDNILLQMLQSLQQTSSK